MVAAMRLTLHCFHRQHIINLVVFLYRHSFDVRTRENKRASLTNGFRSQKERVKIIQNQTSLAINMRSVDTHQPKSTIFAHLLGLQSCLSPTKRGINTQLSQKLGYRHTENKHKVKSETTASQFVASCACLK